MTEVLQPAKILDLESSNSVRSASCYQVMKGAFLITCSADRQQHVFLAKLGVKQKSKVKKADSVITLNVKQHEIIRSAIIDDRRIETIQGTAFTMSKHVVELFEEGLIRKQIDLATVTAE